LTHPMYACRRSLCMFTCMSLCFSSLHESSPSHPFSHVNCLSVSRIYSRLICRHPSFYVRRFAFLQLSYKRARRRRFRIDNEVRSVARKLLIPRPRVSDGLNPIKPAYVRTTSVGWLMAQLTASIFNRP